MKDGLRTVRDRLSRGCIELYPAGVRERAGSRDGDRRARAEACAGRNVEANLDPRAPSGLKILRDVSERTTRAEHRCPAHAETSQAGTLTTEGPSPGDTDTTAPPSTGAAIAGQPWTTACSPKSRTLPLAVPTPVFSI